MKTSTETVEMSPVEESIRMYLKDEINKIGARGGAKQLAEDLNIHAPTISKILKRQQHISTNVISKILEKKGFGSVDELLEIMKDRYPNGTIMPGEKSIQNDENILSCGCGFALGYLPLFLSLKKSEYLREKIKVYASNDNESKKPTEFEYDNLESLKNLESYDYFKNKISTTERQNLLAEGFFDCIFLPELSIENRFDSIPVCRIGGADLVISLVGNYEIPEAIKELPIKEYLSKEYFESFLVDKKIKVVYTQDKLVKELFDNMRRRKDFEEYFHYDLIVIHHEPEGKSNEDMIQEIIKDKGGLANNELVAFIGYAPLQILHKFLGEESEKENKYLTFNFSRIINLNKMSFNLFVNKRIFENKNKLRLLYDLINEIKGACEEIQNYKDLFYQLKSFKVEINDYLRQPDISDPQFSKKIMQNNNLYFIDSLHRIYFPDISNDKHPEALFRRAINHLSFDMSTNESVFTYAFTQLALKLLSEN